ncbi:hypothetical protein BP00DRAFT_124564, partial [Aspergillus indologenus CBS 114.80]
FQFRRQWITWRCSTSNTVHRTFQVINHGLTHIHRVPIYQLLGRENRPSLPNLLNATYRLFQVRVQHIRPQGVENRASRPLSRTQATRREVSSWVGDHQRIPSVVCFFAIDFAWLVG